MVADLVATRCETTRHLVEVGASLIEGIVWCTVRREGRMSVKVEFFDRSVTHEVLVSGYNN